MEQNKDNLQVYLQPTTFINSDSPEIINFAHSNVKGFPNIEEKMIHLYYLVRDGIKYDFYSINIDRDEFKASNILKRQTGFCISKAILLATVARVIGVPSRLGFADVRNHLSTEKVLKILKTDLFVFHGYVELFLHDKWVKATPAFDQSLCDRFGVKPLDFDGKNDSVFQPFDKKGEQYMEYVYEHGSFANLPFELMKKAFFDAYPHLFTHSSKILG